MRFHSRCYGNNIILSDDRTLATRTKSYYHGITFSENPQAPGEFVTLLLVEENKSWNGTIRFGLTNRNPEDITSLPPFSIPDFTQSNSGTWAKTLPDHHQKVGSKIGLNFTNDGTLSLYVDGECIQTNDLGGAVDVSEPVWTLIDVYGSITSVRLIPTEADGIPVEILARGNQAQKAYQEASRDGIKRVYHTRLMLVGQGRVGKTSLRKTLIGERFREDEDITDGIDTSTACEIAVMSSRSWKVCGKDYESENQIRKEYIEALANNIVQKLNIHSDKEKTLKKEDTSLEDASVIEIPTSRTSSAEVEGGLLQQAQNLLGIDSKDTAGIGGNSLDNQEANQTSTGLDNHAIPDEIAAEVERRLRIQRQVGQNLPEEYRQASKTDSEETISMSIWDFAGHDLYYTTHQVFLSSRAVYIAVFNLNHDLNKPAPIEMKSADDIHQDYTKDHAFTCLEYLDFWLKSIYIYTTPNRPKGRQLKQLSPPIFIVGTHRDSLDPDPQRRQKLIEGQFAIIRQHLKDKHYRQHVVNPFYAIENSLNESQNDGAAALRKHIECVLRDEPYMGDAIPLRWLLFESSIRKAVEKGVHFWTLEQVKELTHSLGIESDIDLSTLLQFYHDLGHIIYFGGEDGSNQAAKDLVILDPKWLMDVFRRVITVMDIKDQWPIYMDAWTRLDTEGILEDRLIDHMWSHIIDQKPALLELMRNFDLLCPLHAAKTNEESSSKELCYYVPSLMKPTKDYKEQHTVSSARNPSTTIFYIDFDGFLPDGIFHRLLASAVRWSQEQGGSLPSLHYRHASLYADDLHQIELLMSPSQQAKITVVVTRVTVVKTTTDGSDVDNGETETEPHTNSKVKAFLTKTLAELKQTWAKRIRYSFHIDCPCNTGVPHTLDLDKCLAKDILMCAGRQRIDTAGIKKKFHCLEGSSISSSYEESSKSSISSAASFSSSTSSMSVESENVLATVLETDVKIRKRLGEGGFGTVFLATHKHWGDVAVKQLDLSESVMVEAKQMWRTISSPFLVRIMGIIDDPNHPSIVMEYFKHGNLKSFVAFMASPETLPRKVRMILDITQGMNYLHTLPSPIVHRDLKCDNVFVGEGFKAKIGDLGLAVNMASVRTRAAAERAGTVSHIPPEAWAGSITKPTTYWDIYTFGITLHEILTNGKDPWPQLKVFANDALLSIWVKELGHRPSLDAIPDGTPDDLIDIMKKCWDAEPMQRPSFQELQKQLSKMYASEYENDIYRADKAIMDKITEEKKPVVEELGTSDERDNSSHASNSVLETSSSVDDW